MAFLESSPSFLNAVVPVSQILIGSGSALSGGVATFDSDGFGPIFLVIMLNVFQADGSVEVVERKSARDGHVFSTPIYHGSIVGLNII